MSPIRNDCTNQASINYNALEQPTNPQHSQYTSSNPLVLKSMNETNFLTWSNMNELVAEKYNIDCGQIKVTWYQSFGSSSQFEIEALVETVFTFD